MENGAPGVPSPNDLPGKNYLPSFDEWGLRPDGLVGSHENPASVVPLFVAGAELVPNVGAGGRVPPEAGSTSADVRTPPGAPEASSSGSLDSGPPVAEAMQHAAPEAETLEASGGRGETAANYSPQPGTPKVVPPSTSPATPRTGRHVQRFGRLCVDFEELRKRNGSPSGSGIFGPLKQ